MPADFHFLRPEWLYAIPIVIVAAVLLARRQLGAGHWRDVVDPAQRDELLGAIEVMRAGTNVPDSVREAVAELDDRLGIILGGVDRSVELPVGRRGGAGVFGVFRSHVSACTFTGPSGPRSRRS